MIYDKKTALEMVKGRLDILPDNTSRDAQLLTRIDAAAEGLSRLGIRIAFDDAESGTGTDDLMLLVDLTVWTIQNRDKGEDDPKWLRRRIKERWISERREGA